MRTIVLSLFVIGLLIGSLLSMFMPPARALVWTLLALAVIFVWAWLPNALRMRRVRALLGPDALHESEDRQP